MSNAIGSLIVSIRATVDDFIGDMKGIQKELEETARYVKPLKESLLTIGEAMSAVGDIVAAGMFEITEKTAAFGAELERVHARTGIATEDLSVLAVTAKQVGISFDDVQNAFKRFASSAEAASQGTGKQATAFQELGVSATTANGTLRPTGDLFIEIAGKVGSMADGTQKAALMNDIFGRSGSMLIPLMNELGTEGFDKLKAKAEALGLVFSDNAAANSEAFHQAMATAEQAAEGLGATIGQQLMPMFTDLMKNISGATEALRGWISVHPEATRAVFDLSAAIGGTGGLVLGLGGVLIAYPKVVAAFTAVSEGAGALFTAIGGLAGVMTALSVVAFAGLGAAIGYGIGQFANYVIAITGAQHALDGFAATAQAQVIYQHDMLDVTQKAADVLRSQYKVAIDQGNMSIEEWNKAVTDALRAHQLLDPALQANIAAIKEDKDETHAAAQFWAEYFKKQQEGIPISKELKDAIEGIVKSLEGEATKQLALSPAIKQAIHDHVDLQTIVDKLGKTTVDYVAQLTRQGEAITPELRQIAEATITQSKWAETIGLTTDEIIRMGLSYPQIEKLGETFKAAYAAAQKSSTDTLRQMQQDGDEAIKYWSQVYMAVLNAQIAGEKSSQKAYEAVTKDAEESISFLSHLEKEYLDQQARDADKKVKDLERQSDANAAYMRREAKEVGDAFASIFNDILTNSKGALAGIEDAFKKTALKIADEFIVAFTGSLFAPLKQKWDDFVDNTLVPKIQSFAKTIGDAIGGAFKTAFSSIDPKMLALVGGGAAIGGAAQGITGAIAGGAAGLAVDFLTTGNFIGAAIAGAVAGVAELVHGLMGTGHLSANQFVQQYQNPFATQIGNLANANASALANGTQTVEGAQTTLDAINSSWSAFQTAANAFAAKSPENERVVEQAYAQLGPIVHSVTSSIEQNITDLTQTATDVTDAATQKMLDGAKTQLADIEKQLVDVRSQTIDALNQKISLLDSEISKAQGTISQWQDQIKGLNSDIQQQTSHLNDATFWQGRYNDLIKDAAANLQDLASRRQSLEQQIADLTYQTQVDQLNAIINSSQSQSAVLSAKAQLDALQAQRSADEAAARLQELAQLKDQLTQTIDLQKQAAAAYDTAKVAAAAQIAMEKAAVQQQISSDQQQIAQVQSNIAAQQQYIATLTAQANVTISIIETMGGIVTARQTELEKVDASISALMNRGMALEAERFALTSLLGVAAQSPDIFTSAATAFQGSVTTITTAISALTTSMRTIGTAATQAATATTTAATTITKVATDPITAVQQSYASSGAAAANSPITAVQQSYASGGTTAGSATANYNAAVTAMMGGSTQNNYSSTAVSTVNAGASSVTAAATTHNGIALTTPTGTIYLSAQQMADLDNSGGSYTAASGYNNLVPGAVYSPLTGTYYSPGSVAGMSASQLAALGIQSHKDGGPTNGGLSMLHPEEYVVPKGGALVKGGGGNSYYITIQALDADGVARVMPLIIDNIETNPGGEGDRMVRALAMRKA
jgi:TP901 family phage tail tape measure protein